MSMKTKLLATGVAALLGAATMVPTGVTPASAAPLSAATMLAPAAETNVEAVQYRYRGPGPYRYRRHNPGGAIAAGVALGILGTAIIANQPRRYYDEPTYYEAPPPCYYAPAPTYEYYDEPPPPRRYRNANCYAPDVNGRMVWVGCR